MARRLAFALAVMLAESDAFAQETSLVPGVFFGGSAGGGLARIDQPGLSERWRPGAIWELGFGWQLTDALSIGGQFSTWGTELTLEPVHLHTIGARIDYAPFDETGPFVGGISGLALTEGEAGNRAGFGQSLHLGWRSRLAQWLTGAALAGTHGHVYEDGWAALPFAMLELRVHGLQK
jgi:hypothetical protein